MAPRVLVSDKLSETAVQIFRDRGIDVDFQPDVGKDKEKLAEIIGQYDGLAIRSATKVTEKIIAAADNLKVVGRAGIGVDNVDIPAATAKGIIVMNTPFGNAITTAEHAIAMMMALARQIPAADRSTQAGKWEKSRFMGTEVTGKTLGIVGIGRIGSIVASRAQGLKMKVIAFDPFMPEELVEKLGVERVELLELAKRADFISVHTPLTKDNRHMLSTEFFGAMKKEAMFIDCARGGVADEEALHAALQEGRIAGAALDVFEKEPATLDNTPLLALDNVICTPHLGASTGEAEANCAVQFENAADTAHKSATITTCHGSTFTELRCLRPIPRFRATTCARRCRVKSPASPILSSITALGHYGTSAPGARNFTNLACSPRRCFSHRKSRSVKSAPYWTWPE